MNTYQKLREQGFYSLAAVYKVRLKWQTHEFDVPYTACEDYVLYFSYRSIPTLNQIDYAVDNEHCHNTLVYLNDRAKENIKNPGSWKFQSTWHWNRQCISGPHIERSKVYFETIARQNKDNIWGEKAEKVVRLINRRLAS